MRLVLNVLALLLPFLDLPALNFDQAAEELNAAAEAGMQTYLIVRDGTALPNGCSHPSAANFHQVIH
jgi:methionine salvage enolase-phosphatase E1